jgi:hypothetical protein
MKIFHKRRRPRQKNKGEYEMSAILRNMTGQELRIQLSSGRVISLPTRSEPHPSVFGRAVQEKYPLAVEGESLPITTTEVVALKKRDLPKSVPGVYMVFPQEVAHLLDRRVDALIPVFTDGLVTSFIRPRRQR